MTKTRAFQSMLAAAFVTSVAVLPNAAQAKDWWPFKINAAKGGDLKKVEALDYVPLEKAEKPWNLCVLFPHLKDSYWVSVDYGIVEEAKRLGVKVTVLQAGGYDALPKQLSQYDDCVASGAQGILVAAISEAGLAAKLKEGDAKGLVQIAVANPILETPITARITPDTYQKGFQEGEYLKKYLGDKKTTAIGLPGPQGSGWAESYMAGFRDSTKTGNIKLAAELYGEPGVPQSLRLVEDALQTYPDLNVIWGGAAAAEAAVSAVADAGRDDVVIMSSYENQTMLKLVKEGKVLGFAAEYPVMMGRISVDLAVRALEKKDYEKVLLVAPGIVTKDNVDKIDPTQIFAPDGWKPEFSVQ
ncbi:TMAO reductase system periplasmic protein TorT [Mesorhizobium sp. M0051]|uniref:TMAO reductase system periplasmic protein TorT n=1 Tax=Mesorhizobium sp. M0051 TaxID=2956862 RepID=UPI003336945E